MQLEVPLCSGTGDTTAGGGGGGGSGAGAGGGAAGAGGGAGAGAGGGAEGSAAGGGALGADLQDTVNDNTAKTTRIRSSDFFILNSFLKNHIY